MYTSRIYHLNHPCNRKNLRILSKKPQLSLLAAAGSSTGSLKLALSLSSSNASTRFWSRATNSMRREANVASDKALALSYVLDSPHSNGKLEWNDCRAGQDDCGLSEPPTIDPESYLLRNGFGESTLPRNGFGESTLARNGFEAKLLDMCTEPISTAMCSGDSSLFSLSVALLEPSWICEVPSCRGMTSHLSVFTRR